MSTIDLSGQDDIEIDATLNGKPLERNYITHEELTAGGELVLEMSLQPKFSRTIGGK